MYVVSKEAWDEGDRLYNKKPAFQTTNRLVIASIIWPFQGINNVNTTGGVSTALDECVCLKTAEDGSITSRRVQVENRGSGAGLCGPWLQRDSHWPLVPGHSDTPRWYTWCPWITPPPGRASGPDLLNNYTQTNVGLIALVIRSIDYIDSLIHELNSNPQCLTPNACPSSPFCLWEAFCHH